MSFIELNNVSKIYKSGDMEIHALKDVTLSVEKGEICVIVGESGAGKTTLLNILGGMDTLTSGTFSLDGVPISDMSKKQLTRYRRFDIGFVFQFYNLIQNLTALENVCLSTEIAKRPMMPEEILEKVGLKDRMQNFPSQLSGGEQQRVAIARALAKTPKLLLCDEPTGALDYQTGKSVLKLLQTTGKETGMTIIIITHNHALTAMADRIVRIKSGAILSVEVNERPMNVDNIEW